MSETLRDYGLVPNEDRCNNRFYGDGQILLCQKPIGHGAWHESGDYEWKTESLKRVLSDRDGLAANPGAPAPESTGGGQKVLHDIPPHICVCATCYRHFPASIEQIAQFIDDNFSTVDHPFAGDILRGTELADGPNESEPRQ